MDLMILKLNSMIKKIFIFLLLTPFNLAISNDVYFINLKKVLNESKAGSDAQSKLLKEFENKDKKLEFNFTQQYLDNFIQIIQRQDADSVNRELSNLHPSDSAEIISNLPEFFKVLQV